MEQPLTRRGGASLGGVTSVACPATQPPVEFIFTGLTARRCVPVERGEGTGEDRAVQEGAVGVGRLPTFYGFAIGRVLAAVRVGSGVSVGELARALGMSAGEVLDLESGRGVVSAALVRAWCDRLQVTASSVVGWAAGVAPPGVRGVVVDLRVAADLSGGRWQGPHRKLAVWARRLLERADTPFLAIPEAEIVAMAARWAIPLGLLVALLADLTPVALAPWAVSGQDIPAGATGVAE